MIAIETADENWFHHFEPEAKQQSMEWYHIYSPSQTKARTVSSAAKVMATVFWDGEGWILADLLEPG